MDAVTRQAALEASGAIKVKACPLTRIRSVEETIS
jgi:hypothetical protein